MEIKHYWRKRCPKCMGHGEIDCPVCGGSGYSWYGGQCHHCYGEGLVTCPECNGDGYIDVPDDDDE
jgi:hypothetical protein